MLFRSLLESIRERWDIWRDRGGGDRRGAIRPQRGMGISSIVSDLKDDSAAAGVDGIGDGAPACDLRGRVDSRSVREAVSVCANCRSLADNEAGGGALGIIVCVQGRGDIIGARAHSG